MGEVLMQMSMSLDGYMAGPNVSDANPLGDGGERTAFTFVTDGIASAVAQAQEAAGQKSIYVIGGASIDRQLLEASSVYVELSGTH